MNSKNIFYLDDRTIGCSEQIYLHVTQNMDIISIYKELTAYYVDKESMSYNYDTLFELQSLNEGHTYLVLPYVIATFGAFYEQRGAEFKRSDYTLRFIDITPLWKLKKEV